MGNADRNPASPPRTRRGRLRGLGTRFIIDHNILPVNGKNPWGLTERFPFV